MLEQINSFISGITVPLFLCAAGLFFCFKLGFFHLFRPLAVIRGLRSGGSSGVSSAKAVTLALAGTLGVGNIVGVSSAIHLGGFGAVMWMWISALLAMLLKYAEIVLAIIYRKRRADGTFDGSAMHYIKARFISLGLPRLGGIIAAVFAVAFLVCSLTMGSMLQARAASEALCGVFGVPCVLTGVAMGLLTLTVCARGTKGLLRVTELLVPVMSVGYAVMSLAVILSNAEQVPSAFSLIFSSAFSASAAAGGIGGFLFNKAVRYGVMRGLVSNEAGCGTAPAAHAIADCRSPASQGFWGIFEVFADTVVLCTMTALTVILEYDAASRFAGNYMMMTLSAFRSCLGSYAAYFLCAAVICFALATVLCWSHYGLCALRYLYPNRDMRLPFFTVYSLCVFIGACASSELSWLLSDLSMGIMALINLGVIWSMWREVRSQTVLEIEYMRNSIFHRYHS